STVTATASCARTPTDQPAAGASNAGRDAFAALRPGHEDFPMLSQLLARKTDFSNDDHAHGPGLRRTLGPWGIGAVIGTGIFVVTGTAAAEHAGPAVLISFIIAAICSGFAALCYAEFATLIPISGSSYSYAYASLG